MKWLVVVCALLITQLGLAELRDPTRPEGYIGKGSAASVSSLELNQVVVSPQRKVAVIGGQIVGIGDDVGGGKVISIEENSVQLQGADGVTTLFLVTQPVKQQIDRL